LDPSEILGLNRPEKLEFVYRQNTDGEKRENKKKRINKKSIKTNLMTRDLI
jgi:hypothetical protein